MKPVSLYAALLAGMLLCLILISWQSRDLLFREYSRRGAGKPLAEEFVKEAVIQYNRGVMRLYSQEGRREALAGIPASKNLLHEMIRDVGTLVMEGFVVVYDLADLTIENVEFIDSLRARVYTYEEWNYTYQDTATRQTKDDVYGLGEKFIYDVAFTPEGWQVVGIMPEEYTEEDRLRDESQLRQLSHERIDNIPAH